MSEAETLRFPPDDVVLTPQDVAAHFGVEVQDVLRACLAHRLLSADIGGYVRILGMHAKVWANAGFPAVAEEEIGSFVYFIRGSLPRSLIKIGFSSSLGGVHQRLRTMAIGSPVPLSLLGVIPGGRILERAVHFRFEDLRRRGEWFAPRKKLVGFISEMATT